MYKRVLSAAIFTAFVLAMISPAVPASATDKKVGIWYAAWHTNEARYDWRDGFAVGATQKVLADVNNDNRADAVAYWSIPGNTSYSELVHVALANQSGGFDNPQQWAPSVNYNATKAFFADVDGQNGADFVQYFARPQYPGECLWMVALSNGVNGFGAPVHWRGPAFNLGFGCGSNEQFVADVTGDHKADAVVFFNDYGSPGFRGSWYVAKSTGANFYGGESNWINEFGQGSGKRFLGDVTGDGAADVITYTDNSITHGNWWVAQANGTNGNATGFINPGQWANHYGPGSQHQAVGDVDADGKADAIVYFSNVSAGTDSTWYKAPSSGSQFVVPTSHWKLAHGSWSKSPNLNPATWIGLGNVDGDVNTAGHGSADPVVFHETYKNGSGAGKWRVMTRGDTYTVPEAINIWDAYEIKYQPLINGQPGIFDTKADTSVVDADLQRIDQAGIDYILIDLTNNLPEWITSRAKTVCERVAAYNAAGHNLKFAIATGGSQWNAYNNVAIVEGEAAYVKANFVDSATCGPHYFEWQGKPLIANYFKDTAQKNYWNNSYPAANKTAALSFTMKYVFGELPHFTDSGITPPYDSAIGNGCGTLPTWASVYPQANEFGDYVGWGLPFGSANPGTGRTMVVQPGWNNHAGRVIARNQNTATGKFYLDCAWNKVQANKSATDMVVINSYNEYAEETAVAPTDTSAVTNSPSGAQWPSATYYWDRTVENIAQFKN